MIIIRFHGGLGNQMFQYSFFQYMKKRYGDLLKADITWFDRNYKEHQGYELEKVFGIRLPVATYEEIAEVHEHYPKYYPCALLRYLSRRRAAQKNRKRDTSQNHIYDFGDTQYRYNKIFENLDVEKDWYIEGVFCSDAYLNYCEEQIKQDFSFKKPLQGDNVGTVLRMKQENSVAIHVRRGDYVGNVFDIVGVDYYEAAVEKIRESVQNPQFYVFSDDMDYVKENFSFLDKYVPMHNRGADSYLDMQLISCCKHAVIANSSFSYWGALLGECSDSIIIAPKKYKADEDVALARKNWILL